MAGRRPLGTHGDRAGFEPGRRMAGIADDNGTIWPIAPRRGKTAMAFTIHRVVLAALAGARSAGYRGACGERAVRGRRRSPGE